MKKMKKMLAAILTGGMVLALAACGSGGGESKEEKESDIKIGFVVSDMSDAFFAHLVQELQVVLCQDLVQVKMRFSSS